MAETGNTQSEGGAEKVSPSNAEIDVPVVDGSGERAAPAPVSASSEVSTDAAPSVALGLAPLAAAAGEPLNIQSIASASQLKPDPNVSGNKNAAVPATPPVTPICGDDHQSLLPPIPDPVVIQSAVSTALADSIPSSLPDQIVSTVVPATEVTETKLADAGPAVSAVLPDAASISNAPASIDSTPVAPSADTGSSVPPPVTAIPEVPIPTDAVSVANDPFSVTPTPVAPTGDTISSAPPAVAAVVAPQVSPAVDSLPVISTVVPAESEALKVDSGSNEPWNKRKSELLKAFSDLEHVKNQAALDAVTLKLKAKDDEIELLKARVKSLETELSAALSRPGARTHELVETIKQQHEELLGKARGMIFDKTKIVKNQELQIEALGAQVSSLKDVNSITKDLLEIRNSEIKHLEERMECMEGRFKAEKERHMLVLKRAETGQSINNDLRVEYETQLKLFKELREKYDLRLKALEAENRRLSEASGAPTTSD